MSNQATISVGEKIIESLKSFDPDNCRESQPIPPGVRKEVCKILRDRGFPDYQEEGDD